MHFGTLVAALASWLDCRSAGGRWLLRLEDIDPDRTSKGWGFSIMSCLQAHGLTWDGQAQWQSSKADRHQKAVADLLDEGLLFRCYCSRAELRAAGGCTGCADKGEQAEPFSLRVAMRQMPPRSDLLHDRFLGEVPLQPAQDFAVVRRDGVVAYHLASVVDDAASGVNQVVRGLDLLQDAEPQWRLRDALGLKHPDYGHHTVVEYANGRKLSKQNHSKPVEPAYASRNLIAALRALRQSTEGLAEALSPLELLDRGVQRWTPAQMPERALA